jgi:hypothetical protein
MPQNWSQVARMFYKADFVSSGRDSGLSRAMLPHLFQLMVCSGMRNLSIKHSFVNTLCYSLIFFFCQSQSTGRIILFLVFSLVVAFAANYSLASAARLWHFNLIFSLQQRPRCSRDPVPREISSALFLFE